MCREDDCMCDIKNIIDDYDGEDSELGHLDAILKISSVLIKYLAWEEDD